MITCSRCNTNYDDDASYCNICDIPLKEDNSHYLIDQKKLQYKNIAQLKSKQRLEFFLIGVLLLFPFYALSDYFPRYVSSSQSWIWTFLVLASAGASFYAVKFKKNWAAATIITCCALLLPLLILGSFGAVALIFFWLSYRASE